MKHIIHFTFLALVLFQSCSPTERIKGKTWEGKLFKYKHYTVNLQKKELKKGMIMNRIAVILMGILIISCGGNSNMVPCGTPNTVYAKHELMIDNKHEGTLIERTDDKGNYLLTIDYSPNIDKIAKYVHTDNNIPSYLVNETGYYKLIKFDSGACKYDTLCTTLVELPYNRKYTINLPYYKIIPVYDSENDDSYRVDDLYRGIFRYNVEFTHQNDDQVYGNKSSIAIHNSLINNFAYSEDCNRWTIKLSCGHQLEAIQIHKDLFISPVSNVTGIKIIQYRDKYWRKRDHTKMKYIEYKFDSFPENIFKVINYTIK